MYEGENSIWWWRSDSLEWSYEQWEDRFGCTDWRKHEEVEDILQNPPADGKVEKIKRELIQRLSVSQEQRTRRLLEHEEIGDRTPSQFLRHLRNLAGSSVPDDFINTLWVNRLPTYMQAILATQTDSTLEKIGTLADKIHEANPKAQQISAVSVNPKIEMLSKQIAELTKEVAKMRTNNRRRPTTRSRSRNRRSSVSENHNNDMCWFHNTFGVRAKKCREPCSFRSENGVDSP
ncbi:hypothetical protein NQ315_002798 [Exocentrus adspersus]|uniref:Gag protein n=1 Tax=Exocentrus adspersus TaxID=1586481 RepID=A0AAV8VKL2_9CUCU|nr:hypothetical protein NQ315_002798 [Exocentrus adspersus]